MQTMLSAAEEIIPDDPYDIKSHTLHYMCVCECLCVPSVSVPLDVLIFQLVYTLPVQPGCCPTSTGQPRDSSSSRKCGCTLAEDSTFLKIYKHMKIPTADIKKKTLHLHNALKDPVYVQRLPIPLGCSFDLPSCRR